MIAGILLRHYKSYMNMNFIPICSDCTNKFSVYMGDNGVGKSAILEAIDLFFNNRQWNITQDSKKSEAYICPFFLIEKKSVPISIKDKIEKMSTFFWSNECEDNLGIRPVVSLQNFIEYKNNLKQKYEQDYYFVLCGVSYDRGKDTYFGSFDKYIQENIPNATTINDYIRSRYSYLYIPVEASPSQLLQLQNETMQKLLNKDVLNEIEKILTKKDKTFKGETIVDRINQNLEVFVEEVNSIISDIDSNYSFKAESGNKKKLTAKDIRTKIVEAYFPLRTLKYGNKKIELLSSGEKRKAVIDIAYSTLTANKDKKSDKEIILAIDEPESSMHISNCFDQFLRLERLVKQESVDNQVLVTTHWYGFLPVLDKGNLHHLSWDNESNQTNIKSFNFDNLLETRYDYPDDVSLKSMFDLASSMLAYMRRNSKICWIICEGSDDKVYLKAILSRVPNLRIIAVGGCGNVIKLYQMLYSFMTEKNGSEASKTKVLFLIDTDLKMAPVNQPFQYSKEKNNTMIRRLQIEKGEIKLLDPKSLSTYNQTEMEDCLSPKLYWNSICNVINNSKTPEAIVVKSSLSRVDFIEKATLSKLRGDESFICPKQSINMVDKEQIIAFAENDENKYLIACEYAKLCEESGIQHELKNIIVSLLGL